MSERLLPSAKMVRPADYRHGNRSSYDVIGTGSDNEGILLGQVIRDYGWGSLPWNAYLAVEHPKYGPGVRRLESSPFPTRQKAMIAVLRAWQTQEAELVAHDINATFVETPPVDLDWEARVQELAEELGRAQAHAIPNASRQYRRMSDDELLEEVVFACRSLRRQREQVPVKADPLRTAAFTYQFMLNVSHDRARGES
jgi:hypothetical protein